MDIANGSGNYGNEVEIEQQVASVTGGPSCVRYVPVNLRQTGSKKRLEHKTRMESTILSVLLVVKFREEQLTLKIKWF